MTSSTKIQALALVVVNSDAMMQDALYRSMKNVSGAKLQTALESIAQIASERATFESKVERRLADGSYRTGQSDDIRHIDALVGNVAFARMVVALKVDPRAYLFPQSLDGGKDSTQTSNLKSYRKARQVAECIWSGASDLENVAKVFAVCAFRAVQQPAIVENVLPRTYAECFLNSTEFRSIRTGSQDLFDAIEEVRLNAVRMTGGGAKTQASQMIRTLVALNSATDVRNGRAKDVRIDPQGKVMQALMRRFGQVTDVTVQPDATQTFPVMSDADVLALEMVDA